MKDFTWTVCLMALAIAAPAAQALMVVESWGGEGHFAHAGTMQIDEEGKRITFDLSALPRRAKIHRARLVCFREAPAGDEDAALVNVEIVLAGQKEPLELIPLWYDAFAVPDRAIRPDQKLNLEVRAFPGWIKEKTFLEIAYEGKVGKDLPSVKEVKVVHQPGQTFITWEEIEKVLEQDRPTWREVEAALEKLDDKRAIRYRVYRSERPITGENLPQATLLAEVRPLSGYNINGRSADQAFHVMRRRMLEDMDYAKSVSKSWYGIPRSAHDDVVIDRFVIPGGKDPLPNGTGLYVHEVSMHIALGKNMPPPTMKSWYAVTCVVNGQENTAALKEGVSAVAATDIGGRARPVFQREMDMKVLFDYAGRRLQYVQWADPLSGSNLPNQYYNWSVFVPEGVKHPAPLELVLTGNDMFRRPRWPHRTDTILVSPQDVITPNPATSASGDPEPIRGWYFGQHRLFGTLGSLRDDPERDELIHLYAWTRMLNFLDWACEEFKIDRGRLTCSGDRGYSATAALHFGMRLPQVFSLVYTCKGMPNPSAIPTEVKRRRKSNTLSGNLQELIGRKEWGLKVKAPGGERPNVWEFLDLAREVAAKPKLLRPMLSYGGRGQWDWPPIAKFLQALAQAKQPVISEGTWGAVNPPGLKNPGGRRFGLNVRGDRPIPVFTNCSSDYQGGRNGDGGATNYGAWWDDESIVDEADKFEIIITGNVTVDVTPRRMKNFLLRPGDRVQYKTELLGQRLRREDTPQSGQAIADENGLVTIPKISVRGKAKLTVTRSAS